jgi:hypothetical protein
LKSRGQEPRPSLGEIRAGYSEQKRQRERHFLWVPLVRIPSFYIAWAFVRLGISANQTTYLSIVVGLLGCVLLARGGWATMLVGALLANAWFLFDCVDGNIARYHGISSTYGHFIDTLGGYTMYGLIFPSVGVGLYRYQVLNKSAAGLLGKTLGFAVDPGLYLLAGCIASLAYLLYTAYAHSLSAISPEEEHGDSFPRFRQRRPAIFFIYANLTNFCGLVLPLLALAALVRILDAYILLYAAIYAATLIINTARLLGQARTRLGS